MLTSMEPLVVRSFSFGRRRRTALSLPATLTSSASAPAAAPPARLKGPRCSGSGAGGGGGGGAYWNGGLVVSKSVLMRSRIVTESADRQLKTAHHRTHDRPGPFSPRYTGQK